MLNFWNIAMVFAGTVIGAGFASGQEITQYFVKYGKSGVFGVLMSIAMFTLITSVVLCKIYATGANNVEEYLGEECPIIIKKLYGFLSVSFMFITFCTMVTATGEMFCENLYLPKLTGFIVMYIICVIAFKKGEEGMVGVNKVLTPMIILITIIVFIITLFTQTKETFNVEKVFYNVGTSSMVYVSYNTISIIAILTAVSNLVKNKTTAILAAVTGGMMLLITSLCLWYILTSSGVGNAKIPVLGALTGVSKMLYLPVLFFAMVTTAVSCGFGVIKAFNINESIIIVLLVVLSYAVSTIGFETLVGNIYAVFGYAGFVIGIYTVIDGIKYLKR